MNPPHIGTYYIIWRIGGDSDQTRFLPTLPTLPTPFLHYIIKYRLKYHRIEK